MPRPNDVGVGTAICLLNTNSEMLLIRRKGGYGDGCLSWPGGWVDRGDKSLLAAASREAFEEVGAKVHDAFGLEAVTSDVPSEGYRTVTALFVASPNMWTGPVVNKEPDKCSELLWVPWDAPLHEMGPVFPGIIGAQAIVLAWPGWDGY